MKLRGFVEKEIIEQLKKQGPIPVKWKDLTIGKAYIDKNDQYIIEIFDDLS